MRTLLADEQEQHERIIELPVQTRSASFSGVDRDNRLVHFSFSSSQPVRKQFGLEILSHSPGALDTDRLDRGAVPFLRSHNWEQQGGKIVAYQLGLGKNYATAKLFTSPLGELLLSEIEEGRTEISCGYRIEEMEITKSTPDHENDVYTVTKYEICEISSVSVPADPTVGVGRGLSEKLYECRVMTPGSYSYTVPSNPSDTRGLTEDEIEAERQRIRIEWADEQEKQRLKAIDEKCEKLQYFLW